MIYTIPKGSHYALSGFRPVVHFGLKKIHYKVRFLESCRYSLGNADQKSWNKLFGFSFGWTWKKSPYNKKTAGSVHYDSSRWVWRYNEENGLIELNDYSYVELSRRYSEKPICSVGIEEWKDLYILRDDYHYHYFSGGCSTLRVFHNRPLPNYGLWLYPYFGGLTPASHTMQIEMIRI